MIARVQTLRSPMTIGPDQIHDRPAVARHIASLMAHWSAMEMEIVRVVAALSGTDWRAALTMFKALESESSRVAAISALMVARLPKTLQDRWDALWKQIKGPRTCRNMLAHWLYAKSDDYPDHILLIEPRSEVEWARQEAEDVFRPPIQLSEAKMTMRMLRIREVYRCSDADLETIAAQLVGLRKMVKRFADDAQDHIFRAALQLPSPQR